MEKPKPLPQESNADVYKRFAETTKRPTSRPKKEVQRPPAQPAKKKT